MKFCSLNCFYLAREYPRPKIYNIPILKEWLKNKYLMNDINKVITSTNSEFEKICVDCNHIKLFPKNIRINLSRFFLKMMNTHLMKFEEKKYFSKIIKILTKTNYIDDEYSYHDALISEWRRETQISKYLFDENINIRK